MDRECRTFYSSDSPILPLCIILLAFSDTAGVGNLIVNDSDILQIYTHEFPWDRVNIWNCFGAEMYHILGRWGRRVWGVLCFLTTIFIQKNRIILDSSTVKPPSNVFKCDLISRKLIFFIYNFYFILYRKYNWDLWITVPSSKTYL